MAKEIRTVGVLTSGGDAPGMNAAIRAVVRTALGNELKVRGIRRGYSGLLNEDIIDGMFLIQFSLEERFFRPQDVRRCAQRKDSREQRRFVKNMRLTG